MGTGINVVVMRLLGSGGRVAMEYLRSLETPPNGRKLVVTDDRTQPLPSDNDAVFLSIHTEWAIRKARIEAQLGRTLDKEEFYQLEREALGWKLTSGGYPVMPAGELANVSVYPGGKAHAIIYNNGTLEEFQALLKQFVDEMRASRLNLGIVNLEAPEPRLHYQGRTYGVPVPSSESVAQFVKRNLRKSA